MLTLTILLTLILNTTTHRNDKKTALERRDTSKMQACIFVDVLMLNPGSEYLHYISSAWLGDVYHVQAQ